MYEENGAYEGEDPGPYWHDQIETAIKIFDKWEKRGLKVVKRYRDERDAIEMPRMKFNILWSNIQVLFPALYGRQAKPEVSRRYMDQDPVGRLASTMLERVIEYETTQFNDFDSAMVNAVQDRLLPGRGTVWIRYEPVIVGQPAPEVEVELGEAEEPQLSNVQESGESIDAAMSGAVQDRLLPGRGTAWIRYEPVIVNDSPEVEGVEQDESQVYNTIEHADRFTSLG